MPPQLRLSASLPPLRRGAGKSGKSNNLRRCFKFTWMVVELFTFLLQLFLETSPSRRLKRPIRIFSGRPSKINGTRGERARARWSVGRNRIQRAGNGLYQRFILGPLPRSADCVAEREGGREGRRVRGILISSALNEIQFARGGRVIYLCSS